jgi:hypothetical protein
MHAVMVYIDAAREHTERQLIDTRLQVGMTNNATALDIFAFLLKAFAEVQRAVTEKVLVYSKCFVRMSDVETCDSASIPVGYY